MNLVSDITTNSWKQLKQLNKQPFEIRVPQNEILINSQFNTEYYLMSTAMCPLNAKLY